MPELHDLLSDEAERLRPSHNRPFTELVKARRRRDRAVRLAGAAALAVMAAAGAVVLLPSSSTPRSAQLATGQARTCGAAPVTTSTRTDGLQVELQIPDSAAAGTQLRGTSVLTSDGAMTFQTGSRMRLVVLQNGSVVCSGRTALAGVGVDYDLTADKPVHGPFGTVPLTQRPKASQGNAYDEPLPAGDYDVVGVLENVEPGHPATQIVTAPAPLHVTAAQAQAFDWTVTGRLELVGGPAGTAPTGTEGTVTATDGQGREQTTQTAPDGTFVLHVHRGTYTLTGAAPAFGDGQGVCRADYVLTIGSEVRGGPSLMGVVVACPLR
jgi:hypothetical protein